MRRTFGVRRSAEGCGATQHPDFLRSRQRCCCDRPDRPVALMARAPDSKSGCWGFKSLLACHLFLLKGILKYGKNKGNISKNNPILERRQSGTEESNLAGQKTNISFYCCSNYYRFYCSDLPGHS